MNIENRGFCNGHGVFPTPGGAEQTDDLPADDRLAELIEVAEQHRARLLWVAARISNRREDAEDIVQQAMLKAFTNLEKFRGDSQMRTWLTAIVQNTAREYVRSNRRRTFIPLESDPHHEGTHEDLDLQDPALDPEDRYAHRERVEILYSAIQRMSGGNQHLIQLCVFEELPYSQVASRLNTRLSAVKSRMFRCRHLLRMAAECSR